MTVPPTEIADAMPIIVWTHDADGRAAYFNRRWIDYTGLSLEETLRVGTETIVHPEDRPAVLRQFAEARKTGKSFVASYRLKAKDGSYRWHEAHVVSIQAGGQPVSHWVGAAVDIDDTRRMLDEQRYLVEGTRILGSSLDVEHTLADVAALVVPHLADWCAIDLLEGEILRRAAVAHVDPTKVKLAWELREHHPPSPLDSHGAFAVIRTRTPELLEDVDDDVLAAALPHPRALELVRGLGLRSRVCVPLIARERVLGALTLVTAESGKVYGPRDVVFAEEIAGRISLALDNARLYEEATRARVAAEALATDVLEQSRSVRAELLAMRAEVDAARAESSRAKGA